jgi:hypothetical protein
MRASRVKSNGDQPLATMYPGPCDGGADFPTVWHTVLKGHALVAGIPTQRLEGTRVLLQIPLISRQSLIYDGDLRRYSLE